MELLGTSDDVNLFLKPFQGGCRGDIFYNLAVEEAKELIEVVDSRFIRMWLDEIGAPKSWAGQKDCKRVGRKEGGVGGETRYNE